MTTGGTVEGIGDNKEFTVTAISDVTLYFNATTSASDTATARYFDHGALVKAFAFRPNQTIQIVSINGLTMTDPITIVKDSVYAEKLDTPSVFKMVVRTTVANTHIRLRIRTR